MNDPLLRRYVGAGAALAAALALPVAGLTAGARADEAAAAPVLVELFTAEGCSSCPPADRFLGQLDGAQPIRGAHLIVLSEHVDYWDQQGWPDPYASKAFTERQVEYDRKLKVSEPFTPQFVVDGTIDMRLSRRERIGQQLQGAASAAKISLSIDSLQLSGGAAPQITGTVHVAKANSPCDLFVAVALDHADTEVLRGENRGQHLTHVAVLRDLVRVRTVAPGTEASDQPFSIPITGVPAGVPLRVIAFLQQPGPGAVLGAAERTTGS